MRIRLVLALAAGLALWLAFPSHDLWLLAPVGVGLLALATRDVSARRGLLLGLVTGLAFFLPVLSWSGVYVGKTPWIALAVLESLYVALVGGASALLQRAPSLAGAPRVRPLAIALLWVGQEALRDRTPFGGFPWARLAFSQADSPLVHLAALGGAPAVDLRGGARRGGRGRGGQPAGWAGPGRGVTRATAADRSPASAARCPSWPRRCPAARPAARADPDRRRTGPVHGRPGQRAREPGLDFNAERRAVLDNHVAGHPGRRRVGRRRRPAAPDLVVWPENSSDIDPLRNADAAAVINAARHRRRRADRGRRGARGPGRRTSPTSSLLYRPGRGVTQRYVKQHPVPFAEYIPFRVLLPPASATRSTSSARTSSPARAAVFRVPAASGGIVAAGAASASRWPTTT